MPNETILQTTHHGDGEWRQPFLTAFANSGNIRLACRAAGINRATVVRTRRTNKTFAVAYDEAMVEAIESLEAEARRRAMTTSDTLLIFLLKAHKPEMYREVVGHEVTGKDGGPLQLDIRQLVISKLERLELKEPDATIAP